MVGAMRNSTLALNVVAKARPLHGLSVSIRQEGATMSTLAQELRQWVNGSRAWNMPAYYAQRIMIRKRNAYGLTVTFTDGSKVYVPKGTGQVIIRR